VALVDFDAPLEAGLVHFGRSVVYTPASGDPSFEVRGIKGAAHTAIAIGAESDVSTLSPRIGVKLADFPAPPVEGDQCTVDGIAYRVIDVQPDGEGLGADLVLRRY